MYFPMFSQLLVCPRSKWIIQNINYCKKNSLLILMYITTWLKYSFQYFKSKWWLGARQDRGEREGVSELGYERRVSGYMWYLCKWVRDSKILQEQQGMADQTLLDKERLLLLWAHPRLQDSGTEPIPSWRG